jgi:tRNA(fMet)-specific endonuclease VapC
MIQLDTNVVSQALIMKPPKLLNKLLHASVTRGIALSSVVYGELCFGLSKNPTMTRLRIDLDEFVDSVEVLPWTKICAQAYGDLRATLAREGQLIGSMDLLIAAHAVALDATLVTGNVKEFIRVPGLKIENWAK